MEYARKKSQVTLFFILGIVLVVTIVAMLMLARFASKKTEKQETVKAQESNFDITPIKNFVSECLLVVTEDAVQILGSQGGYLYRSQGGTLLDFPVSDEGIFFVQYENKKVAYNILRPRFSIGKYSPMTPQYPWTNFPYTDETKTTQQFFAMAAFGTNNLPPINISFGQHSIQEQIMRYVERNIDPCLKDSVFEQEGFLVERGNKSVHLDINENDITLQLDYQLTVTNIATEAKTTIQLFTAKIPIRFGKLHRFLNTLIENEISDIKFDILNGTSDDGFIVNMVQDASHKDDVIIVTDFETKINGNEFQYVFARKNRNPAMFLLPATVRLPRFTADGSFTTITNATILSSAIQPRYIDPDEELIEGFTIEPDTPLQFIFPDIEFRVEISDGELTDYQMVKIVREAET